MKNWDKEEAHSKRYLPPYIFLSHIPTCILKRIKFCNYCDSKKISEYLEKHYTEHLEEKVNQFLHKNSTCDNHKTKFIGLSIY